MVRPLLVIEDVLVGRSGLVLLPAIDRSGLHLEAGDVVDLLAGDVREEIELLAVEADRSPGRVRLRVTATRLAVPGAEVWPSQNESGVVVDGRAQSPGLSGREGRAAHGQGVRRRAL
jgi:hypothetical protein